MANNDDTLLPEDPSPAGGMALRPLEYAAAARSGWGGAAAPMEETQSNLSLLSFVHALRRRWLIGTVAGVLCASVVAPLVWFTRGAQYVASAYLRVAPCDPHVMPAYRDREEDSPDAFVIYKETQSQLFKSRFVLMRALGQPDVRVLPSVQREDQRHNALNWVSEQLSVSFPGKAEIMEVSMAGDNPTEPKVLVNALVKAYWTEVVSVEQQQRRFRLNELDKIYNDKETEVVNLRTNLQDLAKNAGSLDSDTLSLKQQFAVQQYAEYRRELTRMEFELSRLQAQLKSNQAILQNIDNSEVPDYEVAMAMQNDPVARDLQQRKNLGSQRLQQAQQMVVPGTANRVLKQHKLEFDMLLQEYESVAKDYRDRVRGMKRSEMEREVKRLEAEVAVLTDEQRQFQQEVEKTRKESEQIGGRSIEVEMRHAELKQLDQVLSDVANERQRLTVELRSSARITILQEAVEPEMETNRTVRIVITLFSMLVGLVAPVGLVVLWDVRAGRINAANDVSGGVGLPVIGSVPLIPARVIRQLGSPAKRNQAWRLRLTESLDGLAARLLRKADLEQTRVILISSPMAGEGKTTLATQLAMSLARNMRRTILVDFDLRRPSLARVFGLPAEPGVCEVLRSQGEVSDMIQATANDNLSVLMAGRWDRQVVAALANGAAASLLDRLRNDYDFVVIDSSPILPVVDTRFVSQHVDMVILSVLRDVSQAPKLLAACEVLEAFGVRAIEAVVTGGQECFYAKGDYESNLGPETEEPVDDGNREEFDGPDAPQGPELV